MTTQLLIPSNVLCLPLCRIYKFGLNTLPSKTVAIPYTCGLSVCERPAAVPDGPRHRPAAWRRGSSLDGVGDRLVDGRHRCQLRLSIGPDDHCHHRPQEACGRHRHTPLARMPGLLIACHPNRKPWSEALSRTGGPATARRRHEECPPRGRARREAPRPARIH